MKDFKDINLMIKRYKDSSNTNNNALAMLTEVEFMAFIYSLATGQFDITGFTTKSFIRYFLVMGDNTDANLALDIINNLPYTKDDFIKLL